MFSFCFLSILHFSLIVIETRAESRLHLALDYLKCYTNLSVFSLITQIIHIVIAVICIIELEIS